MIEVKKEGILLTKTGIEFENEGVLNPAVIREGDSVYVLYRAVQLWNQSTIGYCRLDGPLTIADRWEKPVMVPEFEYESKGVEDPRIVKIGDTYYMTYTAYDGTNARGALATSKDLIHFKKKGIIVPQMTYSEFVFLVESAGNKVVIDNYCHNHNFYNQDTDPEKIIKLWDKNVVFFPRRINGNLVFLHRIRPGIQLVSVKSLSELTYEFWKDYFCHLQDNILMDPVYKYESGYLGSGCPPVETKDGWVMIYHGVEETDNGYVYSACAALLDLNNPLKVLSRLPYKLFTPELEWEIHGEINNVCFPTGTALFGETLFIYYGAADSYIACASLNLNTLVKELLNNVENDALDILSDETNKIIKNENKRKTNKKGKSTKVIKEPNVTVVI